MKIAIIGGGQRGLSVAHLLSHHCGDTFFEREEHRGGRAHSVSAKGEYVAHPAANSKGTDDVPVR